MALNFHVYVGGGKSVTGSYIFLLNPSRVFLGKRLSYYNNLCPTGKGWALSLPRSGSGIVAGDLGKAFYSPEGINKIAGDTGKD
jgi:hypothetical protein